MATKPKDMPREVFDDALREAIDQMAASRKPRAKWTLALDREIWRANKECGLGARPIAAALQKAHGWGSRGLVEDRLVLIRKHGGPDGVPR